MDHKKLTERTEDIVRKYFEGKDWDVISIDRILKKRSGDFFIYNDSFCFLCEVKTVISDKANIPDLPKYYFDEKRSRGQADAKEFEKSNPSKSLVYLPHWHDFICGNDAEFRKKYSDNPRRRNLRYHFENNFVKLIKEAFLKSSVSQLPYHLTIYSNDLYTPTNQERHIFFEWIEGQLQALHEGKPLHWRWIPQERIDQEWILKKHGPEYLSKIYSATYPIHEPKPDDKYDLEATLNLMIHGPIKDSCLELHFDYFEMINLDKIRSTIAEGIGQLESLAMLGGEIDQRISETIPRIIVLAFRIGVGSPDDWMLLIECIKELLKENCTKLSGITVLDWIWEHNTISPSFIMFNK